MLGRRGVETQTLLLITFAEQATVKLVVDQPLQAAPGWQFLFMIWSLLRFDEGLHVAPSSVALRDEVVADEDGPDQGGVFRKK